MSGNIDEQVVAEFGREWSRFDQADVPRDELKNSFDKYFSLFPWEKLPPDSEGFDLGCGSGRWAYFCAPHVGKLHCIEPASLAIEAARKTLSTRNNCVFHHAGVDDMPLEDCSMDFGYSVGVLHHIPDTAAGLSSCVKKLKPGAPFLVYLYYSFDNRPRWFRLIWRASDILRRVISKLPYPLKYLSSQFIAFTVYVPLSRFALIAEQFGLNVSNFPLSAYRHRCVETLRNDALDRFGTRLEVRFSRNQIEEMMVDAGLERVEFRAKRPFWCALGYRSPEAKSAQG